MRPSELADHGTVSDARDGDGDGASDVARTVVLHVGGLHYASEQAVVERVLGRRAGVLEVDANSVAQTATVAF